MLHKSAVMMEFLKIAEEKGLLKEAYPEQNPYAEDKKVIEEKRLPKAEKHIMEAAHPDPVYVAEARGDGGLVENEIENQQKFIEILNKMPSGTLTGRYASCALELVKVANKCDELGEMAAADILTDVARKLFSMAGIMEGREYGDEEDEEEEKQLKWEIEHPEDAEEKREKESKEREKEREEAREKGWARW